MLTEHVDACADPEIIVSGTGVNYMGLTLNILYTLVGIVTTVIYGKNTIEGIKELNAK